MLSASLRDALCVARRKSPKDWGTTNLRATPWHMDGVPHTQGFSPDSSVLHLIHLTTRACIC
jgi:hypothetical protein